MNTKEKILTKALDLFNAQGVEKITTRHIARELQISQGNLHYHYPNKNELIIQLFAQFIEEIKGAERYQTDLLFAKEEVLQSMKDSFSIMYRYRFFFTENTVVWRRLPSIKKDLLQLLSLKRDEIRAIIQHYKKQKIFRASISDEQMDYLAEQFIFLISSWLTASDYIDQHQELANQYAKFTFRNWLPYLNQEEMKKWEAIL